MTNQETEEVIKWFKENPFYHKDHKPFNMAIKALEQQDRIIQIIDDYDLEAWEILEKIKEVVKE